MAKQRFIQWKAFFMLVSFTASFTVFCHCAAAAPRHSCCCGREKKEKKDDHGCQGMQAIKLNLQDKQTAVSIHMAALPVISLPAPTTHATQLPGHQPILQTWPDRHSPPDRQSFYKCFLI